MSKNSNKVPVKAKAEDQQKVGKLEEERGWLEKVGIDTNIYLLLFFMFNAENKKW